MAVKKDKALPISDADRLTSDPTLSVKIRMKDLVKVVIRGH